MKNYKGDEIKRSWGLAAVGATIAMSAIALAGCSNQTVRDLEGIPVTDPDKIRLVTNVDMFPNVVAICIEGAGFAATTRDASAAALQHIEQWDAANDGWCAK
jgi:hypothetical protein